MLHKDKLFTLSQTLLAHQIWKGLLVEGDSVVDATCGQGHDSVFIASLIQNWQGSRLHCIDLQQEAIMLSKQNIASQCGSDILSKLSFQHSCHSSFEIDFNPRLVIYNLGYLPGGDKSITTLKETTLISIKKALELIPSQGVLSVMCYNGHPEGREEQEILEELFKGLAPNEFSCERLDKINAKACPILFIITKR
ncbi:MAG: rRNA methyltransferase [Chlamydiales bacterium]|nr:class I SAM-dependent methyltransferase [Chlamydiales bacterium]NCF71448.1 rRNA methyltransferase [Chlamydiales bacterium]